MSWVPPLATPHFHWFVVSPVNRFASITRQAIDLVNPVGQRIGKEKLLIVRKKDPVLLIQHRVNPFHNAAITHGKIIVHEANPSTANTIGIRSHEEK